MERVSPQISSLGLFVAYNNPSHESMLPTDWLLTCWWVDEGHEYKNSWLGLGLGHGLPLQLQMENLPT